MLGFLLALAIRAQGVNEPDWTEQDRKRESEQAALWVRILRQAERLDPNSKFDALWRGLRDTGNWAKTPGHSAAIDQIYGEIQRNFLATPGHAIHFADLIEKERATLKPGEYGGSYDNHRFWYLRETLSHLPSPETVKVLGHYLDDDRDTPPPPKPDQDYGYMPANSIIALESMLWLGMRDAPYPPYRYLDWNQTPKVLAAVRAWFAPIKSGEKSFSFRGQAVEHRFNPDGTWVSTPMANPPIDPPYPAFPAKPKLIPAPPAPANIPAAPTAQAHQPVRWLWLGGGLLVGLGVLLWQIKIHCTRKLA